jgi:hypothetical protein
MKNAHIVGVEDLIDLTDEEATAKAHTLFAERASKDNLDGFEVWERARVVARHLPSIVPTDAPHERTYLG